MARRDARWFYGQIVLTALFAASAACFSLDGALLKSQPCEDDSDCASGFSWGGDALVCQPEESVCRPPGEFCGDGVHQAAYEACDNEDGGAVPDGCHACRRGAEQIALGGFHSCALRDGEVYCWGKNTLGQLGIGSRASRGEAALSLPAEPTRFRVDSPVVQLALGGEFSCALFENGKVACWGDIAAIQDLGMPSGGDPERPIGDHPDELPLFPVLFGNDTAPVVQLAAGETHACSLHADQSVSCWGFQPRFLFGDTPLPDGYESVPLSPGPNNDPLPVGGDVAKLVAGAHHNCALSTAGDVYCWGGDHLGQVEPDKFTAEDDKCVCRCSDEFDYLISCVDGWFPDVFSPTPCFLKPPTKIELNSPVEDLVAGAFHTCALFEGGRAMRCWGSNGQHQLGDPATLSRWSPLIEFDDATISDIAAGAHHTCVLLDTQEVLCWGFALDGQLGVENGLEPVGDIEAEVDSIESYADARPAKIGEGRVHAIEAGAFHTCALMETGAVRCWGRGLDGQLGNGCNTYVGDEPTDYPLRDAWVFPENPPPSWLDEECPRQERYKFYVVDYDVGCDPLFGGTELPTEPTGTTGTTGTTEPFPCDPDFPLPGCEPP